MSKRISKENASKFDVASEKLKSFYDEFVKLSSKKPDSAVNKFKLIHLNDVLRIANLILGEEYVPFASFTEFDSDDVPSNSDVVMMLAQYLSQLKRFRNDHSASGYSGSWRLEDDLDEDDLDEDDLDEDDSDEDDSDEDDSDEDDSDEDDSDEET